jgi:hypothetical protein
MSLAGALIRAWQPEQRMWTVESMGLAPNGKEARDADKQRDPARRVGHFQRSNQAK